MLLTLPRAAIATLTIAALSFLPTPTLAQSESPRPDTEGASDDAAPSAAGGEAGHGEVGFRIGYYDSDDSGDGNPFLDESLTVIEPVLLFSYNLTDRATIWSKLSYDFVSSASIDRLSNYATQSGASGDNYFGFDWKYNTIDGAHTRLGIGRMTVAENVVSNSVLETVEPSS